MNMRAPRSAADALELFSEWADRVEMDHRIMLAMANSDVEGRLVFKLKAPDLFMVFISDGFGIRIKCQWTFRGNPDMEITTALFHDALFGIRNLMISLNKRQLGECLRDKDNGGMFELLLELQPMAAGIYREIIRERGLALE